MTPFLAAAQVVVNLALWVPLPAGTLWVGSQVEFHSNSLMLGAFTGLGLLLVGIQVGVRVLRMLDRRWIAARQRQGHRQEDGIIGPIAGTCAAVGGSVFTLWLVFFGGIGPSIFTQQ